MLNMATETLTLPGGATEVQWRRSARARRVSLRIDPRGGAVVITLPPRASRQSGLQLLMTHADWVRGRIAALPRAVLFSHGATVPLDGVPHIICHTPGARGALVANGVIHISGRPEFLARRVADFLRAEARRRLSALALAKAALAGVTARRVSVKDTKSRWGSCSATRDLAFCWRLVMAPPDVQDYVAAHEVAHIRHMNHSAAFWGLVDELTDHRVAAIAWLNREGPQLMRIG